MALRTRQTMASLSSHAENFGAVVQEAVHTRKLGYESYVYTTASLVTLVYHHQFHFCIGVDLQLDFWGDAW